MTTQRIFFSKEGVYHWPPLGLKPYKIAKEWGEDIWPCVTVTCPNNCGWKVRLHEKHVHFNLAGHLDDCRQT